MKFTNAENELTLEQMKFFAERVNETAAGAISVPRRLVRKYREFTMDYKTTDEQIVKSYIIRAVNQYMEGYHDIP